MKTKIIRLTILLAFSLPIFLSFLLPFFINGTELIIRYNFPGEPTNYFKTINKKAVENSYYITTVYLIITTTIYYFFTKKKENLDRRKFFIKPTAIELILPIIFIFIYISSKDLIPISIYNIFFSFFIFSFFIFVFNFINESKNFLVRIFILNIIISFICHFFFKSSIILFAYSSITIIFFFFLNQKIKKLLISLFIIFFFLIINLGVKKYIRANIYFIDQEFLKNNVIISFFDKIKIIEKAAEIDASYNYSQVENRHFINSSSINTIFKVSYSDTYLFLLKNYINIFYNRIIKINELGWANELHNGTYLTKKLIQNETYETQEYIKINHHGGHTLKPLLTKLIPRLIYKDKPLENFGNKYGKIYLLALDEDNTTSTNLHPIIDAYINFGNFGIVVLAIINGILLCLLYKIILRIKYQNIFFLSFSILIIIVLSDSNISMTYGGLLQGSCLIFFYNLFLKKFIKP